MKPRNAPPWLTTSEILGWFGNKPGKYRRFVEEGFNEELKPFVWAQRYVGGRAFTKRIKARLKADGKKEALDKDQRFADDLLKKTCRRLKTTPEKFRRARYRTGPAGNALRDMIILLRAETDWTFRRISNHLGISLIYAQILGKSAREQK